VKFSVVIPTYNRAATLRQTLTALMAQDYPDYEIIVVDDGSTDGTRAMIAREFPQVRYIYQQNRGPAAARNRGIAHARGEIIAFTDDDCVPPRDWLARLADGYARYPDVVGVGGYLEAPDEVLQRAPLARYERFIARRVFRVSEREYVGGFECPAGGTNNIAYRRAILERVGGFDESFPYAAGEDADLKWRICQLGARLLYVPVKMTHLQTYTWESFKRQARVRGKGRVCFDAKHRAKPTRGRAVLRLLRRWLVLPREWLDAEYRPFVMVRWIEAWHNFRGEWSMLSERHK
jgi:glycosyltransferase involved in cell wall biosynthesis